MRVKILFLPFEAVGTHVNRNSQNGTEAMPALQRGLTYLQQQPRFTNQQFEAPGACMPKGGFATQGTIGCHLEEIVTQQCTQFLNVGVTDDQVDSVLSDSHQELTPENRFAVKNRMLRTQVIQSLPDFIVLSENPTKSPFPESINISLPGSAVTKKYKNLFAVAGQGVKAVNEMAVYMQEDMLESYNVEPSYLQRPTAGLPAGGKIEHMLQVKVSTSNYNFCFVGVHLRATVTGFGEDATKAELVSLKGFLKNNGVDFAIGDFNLDVSLDSDELGYVGSVYNKPVEYVYPMQQSANGLMQQSGGALAATHQQYSNSTNSKHYMGTLMVSRDNIGPFNVRSGSRSTQNFGFHSDHPSLLADLDIMAKSVPVDDN